MKGDIMLKKLFVLVLLFTLLGSGSSLFAQRDNSPEQGVYLYVIQQVPLSFEETVQNLEQQIKISPFRLVGKLDIKSPEKCPYRSNVLVLYDSAYARQLLEINRFTAPFAMLNRINVFEDEKGVNVAIVNPVSVNRTVLMSDNGNDKISKFQRERLRSLIKTAVPGELSGKHYGEIRDRGYIGRTLGIMAGGSFNDKIEIVKELPGADFMEVVKNVQAGMNGGDGKWGMHLVCSCVSEDEGIAILGTSGPELEAKSFEIVKAGSDHERKNFKCPGLAHAAAYPIEVVIVKDKDKVKVEMLDMMYRMKMYFEDAGKWAFAKNMGMPGSVADDVKNQIAALAVSK